MSIKKKIVRKMNGLVRRSPWFKEVLFPDCDKFWNHNVFNLDVVNLGSTSGLNAFDYEGLPVKAANWALGHNPIMADQEVLNNYFSFLNPQSSTVILCLCPFTSLSGSYDYFEERYYTILRMSSIPHFSYKLKAKVMSMKKSPIRYYPMYAILRDIKRLFCYKNTDHLLTEQQMEKDAQRWMSDWKKEFSVRSFSDSLTLINRDSVMDAATILNEIICFCKERNIRPVMLIPPVYHTLGKKFTPEARKVIIDSLLDKITDKSVWFHNYMDDSDFTNDNTLFQNSFLMNKKGAKLFTRRVLKDLSILKES